MALISSPASLRSLIRNRRTRFVPWSHKDAGNSSRFSHFHHSIPSPPHSTLPIRHRFLLPHPPLRSLLQPRSPTFRSSLPLMTSTIPQAAQEPPPSNPIKTVRVVIKGRVQGVFFRDWTVENANQVGLKGWVRNRRDGSVEALFSGSPESVQEMEQRCRRGPPGAIVTGFQAFPSNDDPGVGFERIRTV